MSEVLQQTLRVLGGWGEGPGWAAPQPSAPHSLSPGLAATLRQLTLCTRAEESELCSKQIGKAGNNSSSASWSCKISVSYPDSFFPDLFPQSGSGSRQQKTNFSKAKTKFWEKFLFSTQKVGILVLFSSNQVGILLNRELMFGSIFKNK